MISTSLISDRIYLDDGTSAIPYEWNGETVLIRDDAKTILEVIELFANEEMSQDEKTAIFFPLFFVSVDDMLLACNYDSQEVTKLMDASIWDVCGLDVTGNHAEEEPLWDPVEDAAYIRISLRQAYGIDWDNTSIPFSEFVRMVGVCPYETILGKAIYYRNKDTRPKRTKYNEEQIADWDRLHKAFALNKKASHKDNIEQQNAVMEDHIAALWNAAR